MRWTKVMATLCAASVGFWAPGAQAQEAATDPAPESRGIEVPRETVDDKSVAPVSPTPTAPKQLNFDDILSYANMEVTVASKVREKVSDAPAVVTALPRAYIDDFRWRSINDVLVHQPGFSLSRDFERDTISMRGIFQSYTNNRLLLLLDGVQQNDTTNGSAFT